MWPYAMALLSIVLQSCTGARAGTGVVAVDVLVHTCRSAADTAVMLSSTNCAGGCYVCTGFTPCPCVAPQELQGVGRCAAQSRRAMSWYVHTTCAAAVIPGTV